MDFLKPEAEPDGESCLTFSHNEKQENDVTEDKVPKIMGCPVIRTKIEVGYISVCMTARMTCHHSV
jgi:hypothetical protein